MNTSISNIDHAMPHQENGDFVDFLRKNPYTSSDAKFEECMRAIKSVSNSVANLQASIANLDSRIDQLQDVPSFGGLLDMAKRIRDRVPVGLDENGATKYEWVSANDKMSFFIKAAKRLFDIGLIDIDGGGGSRNKHLFGECADRYMHLYQSGGVEQTTYNCYRQQMDKHVLPVFGSRFVEDITWTDIQQLYNANNHLNRESKRKLRTVLNIVFNGALKDGYIQQNPTKLVTVTGKPSTPRAILTVEQMADIISNIGHIKCESDRRYMALAVPHAMIPEEILGLRWEDIDIKGMQISIMRAVVHPKRNQPIIKAPKEDARIRTIDIVPGMEQYIASEKPLEGFVFGGDYPLTYQAFRRLYERIEGQINLYGATTYNFRHTVLTDAYNATGDVKAVQAQAGHATPTMTMGRYVHGRSKTKLVANSIAATYKCDRARDKPEASENQ